MFPSAFPPIPGYMYPAIGGQGKFLKRVFPSGPGVDITTISLATGFHIDEKAIPEGTIVDRYLANTCPETAAFTLRNINSNVEHAIITIQRLPTEVDEQLWKSRVQTYMAYKDVGLGIEYYWTVDCSNLDFGGYYGTGTVGMTISKLPTGYSVVPLPQFVICGFANPLSVFTPSYIWNKSWRWGYAEERFMAESKTLLLLRNISITSKVPCRLYAGSVGVMYRNSDRKIANALMLPICSMQANISPYAAKEWADDAARTIWSDIVLGVQTETGTTSYRPHRLAVKWKLGLFVAGAALGWVGGSLLSSYLTPTPNEASPQQVTDVKVSDVEKISETVQKSRPRPAQMDVKPAIMQDTQPVLCAANLQEPGVHKPYKLQQPLSQSFLPTETIDEGMTRYTQPGETPEQKLAWKEFTNPSPPPQSPPFGLAESHPIEYALPSPMQEAWEKGWKEAQKLGKLQEFLNEHPDPSFV